MRYRASLLFLTSQCLTFLQDNEESDFDDDDFSDYDEEEKEIPKEKFAKEVERADRVRKMNEFLFLTVLGEYLLYEQNGYRSTVSSTINSLRDTLRVRE